MEVKTLQKANPETMKWIVEQTTLLSSPELEALQEKIDNLLEQQEKLVLAKTLTKEQLLSLYNGFGYYPKKGDKFWRIRSKGKGFGMYGWQVGEYEHTCHIDTTTIIVLYVIEPKTNGYGDSYVSDHADLWLDGPIVV